MNAAPCDVLAHVANRIIISVRAKNTLAHPCGGVGGAAPGGGARARRPGARTGTRRLQFNSNWHASRPRRGTTPGARDADTAYRMQLYTRCSVTRKLHRAQADTPGGHEP